MTTSLILSQHRLHSNAWPSSHGPKASLAADKGADEMTVIAVRDVVSGDRSSRPGDTPTADVPVDFPREGGVFTISDGFRASYGKVGGKQVNRNVRPRPLSWRIEGEQCLVARSGGAARRLRQYRLCILEPAGTPTPEEPIGGDSPLIVPAAEG